jgi:mRNA export factor
MAVVGTAARGLIVYQLEGSPREYKSVELSLKYQYRCVAIFRDKKKVPTGFAIGSTEGRVAIHHLNLSSKENFTFKCHRTNGTPNGYQDIYAVSKSFLKIIFKSLFLRKGIYSHHGYCFFLSSFIIFL